MFSRSKFYSYLVMSALSFSSFPAAHAGSGTSGGGNFSGLDAAAALQLVPKELKTLGSDLVTSDQLAAITKISMSKSTVVAISPVPIPVSVAGIIQQSAAYTVSGDSSVVMLIYQGDWDAHKTSLNEEVAFMTHEACVALGIEQTGQYGSVSAGLLNRLKGQVLNGSDLTINPDVRADYLLDSQYGSKFFVTINLSEDNPAQCKKYSGSSVRLSMTGIYYGNTSVGEETEVDLTNAPHGVHVLFTQWLSDPSGLENKCAYSLEVRDGSHTLVEKRKKYFAGEADGMEVLIK